MSKRLVPSIRIMRGNTLILDSDLYQVGKHYIETCKDTAIKHVNRELALIGDFPHKSLKDLEGYQENLKGYINISEWLNVSSVEWSKEEKHYRFESNELGLVVSIE